MNILVTGGAGYVGSHTCKALYQSGFTPIVYDNLSRGNAWAVKWGPLEIGDVRDHKELRRVLTKYNPQAVLHFAAYAYVAESNIDPMVYYQNNVVGTVTLVETMLANGINKLVFSSSCATYGISQQLITENHAQNPINPYGRTKLIVEQLLGDYDKAYNLSSISLRYFNAAGADKEGQLGESHSPETHVIPLLIDAALRGDSVFTIHGEDYDTPDGTCVRDFVHVSDLADAHVLALEHLLNGCSTTAYNLGNSEGFSIRQLVSQIETLTGKSISTAVGPRRPGDPAILVGSAKKAMNELKWRPLNSDIRNILSSALDWQLKHKEY